MFSLILCIIIIALFPKHFQVNFGLSKTIKYGDFIMPIKYKSIPKDAIKVPLPDTTQCENYSCGAVSFQAICGYYGVGLEDEWTLIKELKMDPRVGTNPNQVKNLAGRLKFKTREILKMTLPQLKTLLREKKPVMIMIQAWKDRKTTKSYTNDWNDGHWVVAVGYDKTGIYFEDPSLSAIRGYISNKDLKKRWHDVGAHGLHMNNYGIAIWKPNTKIPSYYKRARYIS